MTNGLANLKRIRLVFGKASPLTKTVITAAIALSTVTLMTITMIRLEAQASIRQLQERAAALEEENAQLTEQIDALGTADSIRQIAEDELGLVDPDTIIIDSE